MINLLRRWAWLPGLLCGAGLMIGCGGGAGDVDDDGTSEVIEEEVASPPGVPSTDFGEMPGADNPPRDVVPSEPGLAPTEPVSAPPNSPDETSGSAIESTPEINAPAEDSTPDLTAPAADTDTDTIEATPAPEPKPAADEADTKKDESGSDGDQPKDQ